MDDLTEAAVLDQLPAAFADASLDLKQALAPQLALEQIDGLDSVSRVRLMMSLEELFSIEISPKENSGLRTVGDLVGLVLAKRGAAR
jgi:acyl carrier protein